MKKIINKPWGQECWVTHENGRYAGKLIGVDAGKRLSKQYHEKKHETLYLLYGKAEVELDNNKLIKMNPKDVLEIKPKQIHRIKAIDTCVFIEFSSPELEDIVRIEDDYGRC